MVLTIDVAAPSDASQPRPRWAVLQRQALETLDASATVFVEAVTRPEDRQLRWHAADSPWRDAHGRTRTDPRTGEEMDWPGIDGSDDGYEAFCAIPLLYCLGGSEQLHSIARRQWVAVTEQFTGFGQVHDEFDANYDWMHHGESSQYIYYLGLADPHHAADRGRSLSSRRCTPTRARRATTGTRSTR